MGIREQIDARVAMFISIRELVSQLAALENVSITEAAGWLISQFETDENNTPPWSFIFLDRRTGLFHRQQKAIAESLFTDIIQNNGFWSEDPLAGKTAFNNYGWLRKEIFWILKDKIADVSFLELDIHSTERTVQVTLSDAELLEQELTSIRREINTLKREESQIEARLAQLMQCNVPTELPPVSAT